MARERIHLGLGRFETLFHGKRRKTTFSSEMETCFEYFDEHSPKHLGNQKISEIHSSGIVLRRVEVHTPEGKKNKYYMYQDILHAPGLPPHRDIITVENRKLIRIKEKYPSGRMSAQEITDQDELRKIVNRIHGITLPYSEHIKQKLRKS